MSHKTKKRSYGFLTTDSFIVEVQAYNPKQAHKLAIKRDKYLRNKMGKKLDLSKEAKVTKSYVTYGRYGFAPVGIYKQVK
jgi:hypothetical protein